MLADVYVALTLAGVAVVVLSTIHHLFIRGRDRDAEAHELVNVLKDRERGIMAPLPDHSVFASGTLSGALGIAFTCDSLVSALAGTFKLQDVAVRAAMVTLVAGGVQYAVTQMRRDRTPLTWPNSPWLCWVIAATLGVLGAVAEATSPGSLSQ